MNDMYYIRSIFFLWFLADNAFGHESESDHHPLYSFKDRIHEMCAGHHHMDGIELKEICNHFSEHFSDILELQAKPPEFMTEKYITSLTALVIFSDTLTVDQKHKFYRRSYDQALTARKNGDQWKWLLGMLVERTDALSLPELQDLMRNTTHEPMKPLIEKAIDRKQRRSEIGSRTSEQELNKREGLKDGVEEEQPSLNEEDNRLPWMVAGVVLLGILMLLMKKIRGNSKE